MEYDFPGNVRELENIIEHAFVLCKGVIIRPEHLPEKFQDDSSIPAIEIASSIKEMEGLFLIAALKRNNWNRKNTAKELKINQSTLYRKLKKIGLKLPKNEK
jgi:transcriptional regulator of acetoin/glycerol metabolism